MSFVEQDDVIELGEAVARALWSELAGYEIPRPIPRITYAEAMGRYGSDKPDLRFAVELTDLTEYFARHPVPRLPGPLRRCRRHAGRREPAPPPVRRLAGVGAPAGRPRSGLRDGRRRRHARRGARSPKNLSDAERAGLAKAVGAEPGDASSSPRAPRDARALLGAARGEIARRCGAGRRDRVVVRLGRRRPDVRSGAETTTGRELGLDGRAPPVHVAERRLDRPVRRRPGNALAYAYDIVCNGNEIGGGSIRIHRADVQQRVFALLGLDEAEQREKFGFLLDAFAYGPPPHGGIAFGWDRILHAARRRDSLREVIAFPKTGNGFDPLTSAPAPITAEQRREAGVDADPPVSPAEPDAAAARRRRPPTRRG